MKPTQSISRRVLFVALAWLATLLVAFWALTVARQRVIASLNNPEARAHWQRWQQEEAARQADPTAPVRRRTPKSPEPPALVLMRDSFPAIVAAAFVVVTLCVAFAAMCLHKPRGDAAPSE